MKSTMVIPRVTWALLLALACLFAFRIVQAADPESVQFTLEGCRSDGSIILPNGSGQFICPDDAYTTGNLGKGWNELDLVPYRLDATAGNSAPSNQTYTVAIVVDNEDAGAPGYDVLSAPVLNTSLSDAACVAPVVGNEIYAVPGLGGIDKSLYRLVTITQAKNTTCVYDYYARLALGSHEFPGSSLHANLALPDASAPGGITTQGIGARDVSIPVKEIAPQELDKDMSAIQGTDHDWTIRKEPTPARVAFGDTCDAAAPLSASVKVEITWTKEAATPSGTITVKTFIYATNPAARIITVNVTDKIYAGATLLDTVNSGDVDVPANTANYLVLEHEKTGVDASATDLNDVATATYIDKVTGVPVPGITEATASATVELTGPELNQTATINDVESLTGAGLSFSADSFTPAIGSFDGGYVAGTETIGPVSWTSDPQSGSGSVTFDKTIYVDAATSTSGDLSDIATLNGSDGLLRSTNANIAITADARVKLTINKTLNPALTAGSQTFTFHVLDSDNVEVAAPTITFNAGETNKSVTIDNLAPDVYTVVEDAVAGYIPQDPKSVNINLPSCSGEVSFSNVKLGRIIVDKVTVPANSAQKFDFTLTGGPSELNASFALADADTPYDSGYVLPGSGYAAAETVPDGWDLTGAVCSDGSPVGNIDVAPGETVTCTFTNTQRGLVRVIKTVQGAPLTEGQEFTFQLRKDASIVDSGTTLETKVANASNSGVVNFTTLLIPGATYQLCEIVMPGWTTTLGTFVPGSFNPPDGVAPNPNVDNSILCINFTVQPGETKEFSVDNTPPPGGRALTIGFWKNWASCAKSNGKQEPVLDQTLALAEPAGIPIGSLVLHGSVANPDVAPSCLDAVRLLDKSRIDNGKKMASDSAFNMAAQQVAVLLNFTAGAGKCPAIVTAAAQAQQLLVDINFNGKTHGPMSAAQISLANTLAKTLDNYNNNRLCAPLNLSQVKGEGFGGIIFMPAIEQ